jgi:hypothetical protein
MATALTSAVFGVCGALNADSMQRSTTALKLRQQECDVVADIINKANLTAVKKSTRDALLQQVRACPTDIATLEREIRLDKALSGPINATTDWTWYSFLGSFSGYLMTRMRSRQLSRQWNKIEAQRSNMPQLLQEGRQILHTAGQLTPLQEQFSTDPDHVSRLAIQTALEARQQPIVIPPDTNAVWIKNLVKRAK